MRKYSIPAVAAIFGTLFFVLGAIIGDISTPSLSLQFEDLTVNIAATFVSLAILALFYEILGGEPITNLIEQLIKLQGVSRNADIIGIEDVVDARRKFNYERIHKDLKNGREMFIASRTFDSIKYSDVKSLFRNHLEKKSTSLKILIESSSIKNIQALIEFRESLPEAQRRRFEIRQYNDLSCCIYGSDYRIYITPYLNHFRGEESPSILCCNKSRNSVYHIYREEFYGIWEMASSI